MDKDKKINLEALEELILDEEKLVTYLYVSQKLCIHVNESKKLLSQFVKEYCSRHPKGTLHVKFIISGLINDNKACTIVCPESELPKVKKEYKLIFFEHVYCISKSSIDDNVILSAVNNYSSINSCLGAVKNSLCSKYSDDEISKRKNQSYNASLSKIVQKPANSVIKQEPNQEAKPSASIKMETKSIKPEPSPKKKPEPSPASKGSKHQTQKGISGFFNKQNNVKKEVVATPKDSVPDDIKSKKSKSETSHSAEIHEIINSSSKSFEIKMEIDSDTDFKDNRNHQKKSEKSNKSSLSNKNKSSSNNTKNISKSTNKTNDKSVDVLKKKAKVDKKRKRVLHISDSESEDEKKDPFEDETEESMRIAESEDEIPPTPTTNVVKVVSGAINPKKKRKIVDKVYTDEDGYILTKKEEVYESCSEGEEAKQIDPKPMEIRKEKENLHVKTNGSSPNKKSEPKKSKKKISPPQKGKQSTLMSFFSKK